MTNPKTQVTRLSLPEDWKSIATPSVETLQQRLLAPFPATEVEVRAGSISSDKTKRQALYYLTTRSVQKRLDSVFGIEGWSISKVVSKMEPQSDKNLLASCVVTVKIHHPLLKKTVSNIGEVDGDDTKRDNKNTSAYAQAFKRTCTLLGVGAYLYYTGVKYYPHSQGRWEVTPKPTDDQINASLKAAGFRGLCEKCGERVPWRVAAASMDQLGAILCAEHGTEYKKLLGF